MSAPRILIAGGGSGGHVTPGIAVAEALKTASPDTHVHLVCSDRPIDARVMDGCDLPWTPLPAVPMRKTPTGAARCAIATMRCMQRTRSMVREQRIDLVLLHGGFVAGPVLLGARRAGVPTVMVNLDVVPGRANRIMSRLATHCATAVDTTRPLRANCTRLQGVPVRAAAMPDDDKPTCARSLGLQPDRRTLLVTGASQGARTLNDLMRHLVHHAPAMLDGWQVLHLAGHGEDDTLRDTYAQANIAATVLPYLDTMGLAWGAADACLSRAGASSIAEATYAGVPAVYLPYPWHRDKHQWHNAQESVTSGRAVIVDDRIDPHATWPHALPVLESILQGDSLGTMQTAADRTRGHDAAAAVAAMLLALQR